MPAILPFTHHRRTQRRAARLLLTVALLAGRPPVAASAQETALVERAAVSRARGPDGAPVLVYEIADFQCPYCARFSLDVLPRIDSAYVRTGKVQWVFVNLPLPMHPRAWAAAEAALCAGGVGDAFWDLHDRLFAEQHEWADAEDPLPVFLELGRAAGVPAESFRECLLADHVAPLLLRDVVFAASADISGTPSFIIDGERTVVGLKSFEEWAALLDEALRRKTGGRP